MQLLVGLLMALSGLALGAGAQEPRYTMQVTAREVVVDVVVTDKAHRPVGGMTEADFQVFEWTAAGHGRRDPQRITGFRELQPGEDETSASSLHAGLGGVCAARYVPHYQIAYRVNGDNLAGGFHEIVVTTERKKVKLLFGHRYYVGSTEALADPVQKTKEARLSALEEAACFHAKMPLSLTLDVKHLSGVNYKVQVTPASAGLVLGAAGDPGLQLDFGVCSFGADGGRLAFGYTEVAGPVSEAEVQQARLGGMSDTVALPDAGVPVYARFVVRDARTGNVGAKGVYLDSPAAGAVATDQSQAGLFGTVLPQEGAFCGDVYDLPLGTKKLPDYLTMMSTALLYSYKLDVPHQLLKSDSPGVMRRMDSFGIDYYGTFYVSEAGKYGFELMSDDGAELFIDGTEVIDHDGLNPGDSASGKITLTAGKHTLHVPYFQGLPDSLGLQLWIEPPGGERRVMDLRRWGAR